MGREGGSGMRRGRIFHSTLRAFIDASRPAAQKAMFAAAGACCATMRARSSGDSSLAYSS